MTDPAVQTRSLDAAQRWFAELLDPGCTEEDKAAFERWRATDPAHAAAYARVEQFMGRVTEVHADPAIRQAAQDALHSTAVFPGASRKRSARRFAPGRGDGAPGASRKRSAPRWGRRAALALAASLVLAFGLAGIRWVQAPAPVERYATPVGERRDVRLPDGSELLLDASTRVDVRYTQRERHVAFHDGRARYTVAHDPRRPFVVEARGAVVTARGTEFQTAIRGGLVTLTLLDGAVSVESTAGTADHSATLQPGEQLTYDAAGSTWSQAPADLATVDGWTHGTLIFRNERLQNVVEEANRYSDTPLRIADPALADLRITGAFQASDRESLILALQQIGSLRVRRTSTGDILLSRE